MRNTRPATPAMVATLAAMNGKASLDSSRPATTAATTSRERGPATANCAH